MPSGAWKVATLRQRGEPLVQPRDPAHSQPVDEQDADFVDTTGAPHVPLYWDDNGLFQPLPAPSPFVDTTPQSHGFGVGDQPGIDQGDARELAAYAHNVDRGTFAATHYAAPGDYVGAYSVLRVRNHDNVGDSPAMQDLAERTGVGTPTDPDARRNVRIQRWRDQPIDMHWHGVQMRPLPVANARTAQPLPVVAHRQPWVSPFGAHTIDHPDNWETPQERRTPRNWAEGTTGDGTAEPAMFGLGTWGM